VAARRPIGQPGRVRRPGRRVRVAQNVSVLVQRSPVDTLRAWATKWSAPARFAETLRASNR
jgi:hypothetical protein